MDRAVGEIDHGRNRLTDLKRKRAVKCAAFLMGERCGKNKRAGSRRGLRFPPAAEGFSHGCGCCSGKSMINNYANFRKSGLPKRIMFFSKGEWCDFPAHLMGPLVDAFGNNRSAVEVALDGQTCLVDFLHMLLIDLRSGLQQSVSWIDESDRCFFPKFFFDDNDAKDGEKCRHPMNATAPEIEVKLEIDISAADSSKTEDQSDVSISHAKIVNVQRSSPLRDEHSDLDQGSGSGRNRPAEIEDVVCENGDLLREGGSLGGRLSSMSQGVLETFGSESLRDKIVSLDRDSSDYTAVRDVFLLGLGTLVTASHIVGIYRYSPTSSSAQARMQLFENQVHVMKGYRGDANVRYAWHGSSRDGIVEIILHGFGRIRNPIGGVAYGSGIYLSPKECALISASFSDDDEKGLQHMVLCRVIMGNMEQVPLGSAQICPSSDSFDSGVDDLRNPKYYIIWGTHMNTHIQPEYVVSFKVPPAQEYWARLKESQNTVPLVAVTNSQLPDSHVKQRARLADLGSLTVPVKRPTSTWMPFPLLFAAIEKHISAANKKRLDCYYDDFKGKKLTREELIKRLRSIAGDDLLIATLKNLRSCHVGCCGTCFDCIEEY